MNNPTFSLGDIPKFGDACDCPGIATPPKTFPDIRSGPRTRAALTTYLLSVFPEQEYLDLKHKVQTAWEGANALAERRYVRV